MSTLVSRNIFLTKGRTSLRLEPAMWEALEEIARREDTDIHDLCERVDCRRSTSTFAAAIRVFVLSYFRLAAGRKRHARAGEARRLRTAIRRAVERSGGQAKGASAPPSG